jgi:ankyrin repeat protein
VYYLLGWNASLTAKDEHENTPLHVAVIHNLEFGDLRSVKEMLIRGASRDAKNKDGLRPITEIARMKDSRCDQYDNDDHSEEAKAAREQKKTR